MANVAGLDAFQSNQEIEVIDASKKSKLRSLEQAGSQNVTLTAIKKWKMLKS